MTCANRTNGSLWHARCSAGRLQPSAGLLLLLLLLLLPLLPVLIETGHASTSAWFEFGCHPVNVV